MSQHYVDNKKFLAALKDFKKEREKDPKYRIPEYIGQCILEIATRFSSRPSFCGYTYRDDMQADAIENCILYIDRFDPTRYSNPFAYFSQICYYAFIRRIMKEKKQSYVKHQIIHKMPFEMFQLQEQDANKEFIDKYTTFIHKNNAFDGDSFARNLNKKKLKKIAKKVKNPLESLMDTDDQT